jgi:PilZ domain
MAQETNEGIAYLMALKRSGSDDAAATPARTDPETLPEPVEGNRFKGAEKRRGPRYKCEGSAEIREDGCDVRTWATFSDISVHGCYVEAQATYPANTVLHMKLEANGIRVETKGNVRVNYPYLGMGIAFADMSEENQAQLKQLLASIARPCMIMGPGIASSLPATDPLKALPLVTRPEAAIEALVEFFESRQMLMRDDFLRILRKSQSAETRR